MDRDDCLNGGVPKIWGCLDALEDEVPMRVVESILNTNYSNISHETSLKVEAESDKWNKSSLLIYRSQLL